MLLSSPTPRPDDNCYGTLATCLARETDGLDNTHTLAVGCLLVGDGEAAHVCVCFTYAKGSLVVGGQAQNLCPRTQPARIERLQFTPQGWMSPSAASQELSWGEASTHA